jgi:hypothetical protein
MSAVIRLLDARGRRVVPEAHAIEVCRAMAELPDELRRRVAVARGLEHGSTLGPAHGPAHGDVGAAGMAHPPDGAA